MYVRGALTVVADRRKLPPISFPFESSSFISQRQGTWCFTKLGHNNPASILGIRNIPETTCKERNMDKLFIYSVIMYLTIMQ